MNIDLNLDQTIIVIKNMMSMDNFVALPSTTVLSALNIAIQSDDYVNTVKNEVSKIKADGKFTISDVPAICIIVLKTQTLLNTTIINGIQFSTTFNLSSIKYLIFGVLYYVMLIQNVDPLVISELMVLFPAIWNLISFDPKQLVITTKSNCKTIFPCCFSK